MNEKKAMFIINILKNIINVYFDTFFVFYFFKVSNYEIISLAQYYLIRYLFTGIGFFILRNSMKKNIKVPYFRIGISLEALYIASIMLLKENIIQYVVFVSMLCGLAEGLFYYPKNILETEKINNNDRQKYSGKLNIINKLISIIIPVVLGYLLTYFSYVEISKGVFILFIIMFFFSFYIDDDYHLIKNKLEIKKFLNIISKDKLLSKIFIVWFLSGLTYSSGVMATIITLTKINVFKTNLNLGYVEAICAFLSLVSSLVYMKINRKKFSVIVKYSGIISSIVLLLFSTNPIIIYLVLYLFIRNSLVFVINMISNYTANNISNDKLIKEKYKAEYFLTRDIIFCVSRCFGYLILLLVSFTFGIKYITYILIVCAISLLIEGLTLAKIIKYKA